MIFKSGIPEKNKINILLIGCGGTGGFIAQHLSRIIYDLKIKHEITFLDGDKIEKKNIGRQNFFPREIGLSKAEALAKRYSISYGLNISYYEKFIEESDIRNNEIMKIFYEADLIISALDNTKARKIIHEILKTIEEKEIEKNKTGYLMGYRANPGLRIWIDTGNEKDFGQILIGNTFIKEFVNKSKDTTKILYPSVIEPSIIKQQRKKKVDQPTNCADAIINREQSTTINNTIASITASIIYKLLTEGTLTTQKIIVNESIPAIIPEPLSETIKKIFKKVA